MRASTNVVKRLTQGGGLVLSTVLLLAGSSFAHAPTISGHIDTTYTYNLGSPKDGFNRLRSYDDKDNTIALNSTHLAFTGSMGDAGYNIEVDAGRDAELNNGTRLAGGTPTDSNFFDVQEAYLTYKCPKTLIGLKVGKFVTPEGIEVIESKDNPTISRGYL